MTINYKGLPINLAFNFSNRSYNLRETVLGLLQDGKPFALYCMDRDYKIYIPALMCSISDTNAVLNYGSLEQFQADISFDIMIYDFVADLSPQLKIEDIKLITFS